MSVQDCFFVVVWAICGGLLVCLFKQNHRLQLELMAQYAFEQLSQVYFCSYSLLDVYLLRFFPRYREFVDWGFCAPTAAMSMLALKNHPTARYVYARAGKERYRHCWVEFRYPGTWYVIDDCWCYPFIVPRRTYYRKNKPQIIATRTHKQFWDYPISHQFYEKMQKPETSWLLCELMHTYGFFISDDSERLFDSEIETATLSDDAGNHLDLWLLYKYPQIIFSRRIMHEMMQRPKRKRPTAHRIRKVQRYQRRVKAAYEQFIREHPEYAA